MYERIDDVVLQHDIVTLINGSNICSSDVVLSVCIEDAGWPRTCVGADNAGSLLCRKASCCSKGALKYNYKHCKAVGQWLSGIEQKIFLLKQAADNPQRLDRLLALAAATEGLSLRQDAPQLAESICSTGDPSYAQMRCHQVTKP